jgi:hypothetical protein
MKRPLTLAAAVAAALFSFGANAAQPGGTSLKASQGEPPVQAGLMWRCPGGGWGWPGNGCIKQKLKAKKK